MFLARVQGHVVATAKDRAISGFRLLIVEPLKVAYADAGTAAGSRDAGERDGSSGGTFEVTGRAIVALDTIGAGEGQLVLVAQGSSARMAEGCGKVPTDAVILGLVDSAKVGGREVT